MAYLVMPALREPFVCEQPCAHIDCALTRAMVDAPCEVCRSPVVAGDKFLLTQPGNRVTHFGCA